MVILGILAAVAVPLLISQSGRARTATAKADAETINKQVFSALVDGDVSHMVYTSTTHVLSWTNADGSAGTDTVRTSPGNTLLITGDATAVSGPGGTGYCVTVTSKDGSAWHAGSAASLRPGIGSGNC